MYNLHYKRNYPGWILYMQASTPEQIQVNVQTEQIIFNNHEDKELRVR